MIATLAPVQITLETTILPSRTGDPDQDSWTQLEVYGLLTNPTDRHVELASGTLTFHDAAGALVGVDSIGTAVKADVGDVSPGETVYADVAHLAPGQSVPFHLLRNLAAFDAPVASVQVHPRGARFADDAPAVVVTGLRDAIHGEDRTVTAALRNDGAAPCRAPALVVAVLDAAGRIASVERIEAGDDLGRLLHGGETITVHGSLSASGEDAWRATALLRAWADCRPVW